MILLDTNVVSQFMRGEDDPVFASWLEEAGDILFGVSVVSVAELTFGIERAPVGRRRQRLEAAFSGFLGSVEVIEMNRPMAERSGAFRARRETLGRPLALADSLIAATAYVQNIGLATRNVRDFEGLGLRISNPWEP